MVKEILSNFLKDGYAPIMIQKIRKRFFEYEDRRTLERNIQWCKNESQNFDTFAINLDKKIYNECKEFEKNLSLKAKRLIESKSLDLGGGGHYPFLYFLTRYLKPEYVVETGVAAGYSSQAFLEAMRVNGKGSLFSSDFPYFRFKNPEQYIGILVDDLFKERWNLLIKGDKVNLPKIASVVPRIDIFHYDSDKTYSGRLYAFKIMKKLFHHSTVIIMDDIQDNLFFYDYVKNKNLKWRVFEFYGKYVGIIGI